MSELMNFADLMDNSKEMRPLSELVSQIMEIPDNTLNEQTIDILSGAIDGALTPAIRAESVKSMMNNFEEMGYTKESAKRVIEDSKNEIRNFIKQLSPSANKEMLLNKIFTIFFDIFDNAVEQYHNFSITLPIMLEEGAQVPTYAHEGDAAADLYAADDTVIAAHSIGNMIRTGVHIALPEGWVAFIFPRSSIGAKTPLRLSNSAGIVDSGYRGSLGVLYDNISDSDWEIKAGERIAQLMVMPSYHFKAQIVDKLEDSERGEGGFGSSGK